MTIGSTHFDRKNIHKITWILPDGETKYQIEHVMIDKRYFPDLMDIRIYKGSLDGNVRSESKNLHYQKEKIPDKLSITYMD